jgi:hypothetical protein
MPVMRAKVKLQSVHSVEGSDPTDGMDEDNTFAKFSPSANFSICVANPALLGKLKAGQKYYVDFTEA